MPPDIRSFFGGRGLQVSSQEQAANKVPYTVKKSKGRGKRKVVVTDSDDEEQDVVSQERTPKKPPPKKQIRDSPVGELTTTSDYFASSGKSKPARSTPDKPKATSIVTAVRIPQNKHSATRASAAKTNSPPKPPLNGRTSSRKKLNPSYVISPEPETEKLSGSEGSDEFKPGLIKEDGASGDDIFGADFKGRGIGADDDYQSEDEEDVDVQQTRRTTRSDKKAAIKNFESSGESDVDMKNIDFEKQSVKAPPQNRRKTSKARKRKSMELDHDDHEEEEEKEEEYLAPVSKRASGTKTKSPAEKPASKKRRTTDSKEGSNDRSAVQDIFDAIPTIRPPTPPVRDTSQKFDFRAAGQRSQAPPVAGSKEAPVGAENCLAGLTFVFTGLLEFLGREEGIELVKRYGGKVTTSPSKKTSYVVMGSDAGPKKLETIAKLDIKVINESGLFELIRRLPANGGDGEAAEKFEEKKKQEERKIALLAAEMERQEKEAASKVASARKKADERLGKNSAENSKQSSASTMDSRLWTTKYAPTNTSMICGNKSQVEKLQAWLRAWPNNVRTKFKKPGKDGYGVYRAVIIHGPPGIGKTTAAHLAATLEGYDIVESNASDTRSKKLVETGLKGVLDTTSLLGYFAGDGKKVEAAKKKLVLIMDEVDGMSAGDRGGVGALANVCKKTSIPMILICNDRKLPKMKPFDHVTYDLPFRRPTTEQIRSRIMTICFRENLNVPPNVINALIEGSRADIRQVINMLSTAKLDQNAMDFDQGKTMSKSWEKHVILKPWDIVSKILGGGMFAPNSSFTLNDKIELYFNDHEFSSLMLQENYLGTNPVISNMFTGKEKNLKLLELVDNAAESISDGDLVDRMIHGSQQQWSLMPTHAVFSFVRPASFVSGSQAGHQTRFTSWLGNHSKTGKLLRFIKEIQGHMRLRASGDRHEIRQQYLPLLWYRLIKVLEQRGKDCVEDVIELMDSYFLTKDDWDAILELGVGPMSMESVKLETQTKASFTRVYNQQSHPLPYMKASNVIAPKKLRKDKPDLEEALDDSDSGDDPIVDANADNDDDEDAPLDLKKDKYVRAPKKRPAPRKSATKNSASKAKGKGKVESEEEMDDDEEDDSEEDVKPKKGRLSTKGKTTASRSKVKR